MIALCPFCGGLLKAEGTAFLCPNCSTKFDSKEELEKYKMKEHTSQATSASIVVEKQADHGADVFDANIKGVLEITWSDGKCKHSGSGFLIAKDGLAITNTHVVTDQNGQSCKKVAVKICGENVSADVVRLGDQKHGSGDGIDLALIKLARVPQKAKPLSFENYENVRNGEKIFVIGNSLGFGTCITGGIVSDKARRLGNHVVLMTDCAVNPGNSGGPMFNEKGLVIGTIVSGITEAEGMNFAIPANEVLKFIRQSHDVV